MGAGVNWTLLTLPQSPAQTGSAGRTQSGPAGPPGPLSRDLKSLGGEDAEMPLLVWPGHSHVHPGSSGSHGNLRPREPHLKVQPTATHHRPGLGVPAEVGGGVLGAVLGSDMGQGSRVRGNPRYLDRKEHAGAWLEWRLPPCRPPGSLLWGRTQPSPELRAGECESPVWPASSQVPAADTAPMLLCFPSGPRAPRAQHTPRVGCTPRQHLPWLPRRRVPPPWGPRDAHTSPPHHRFDANIHGNAQGCPRPGRHLASGPDADSNV